MKAELTLDGKAQFRRRLKVSANQRGYLWASLYLVGAKGAQPTMLAYANMKIADCYLQTRTGYALWFGSTAFDLSDAEAAQIRATFKPVGLRIESADELLGFEAVSA